MAVWTSVGCGGFPGRIDSVVCMPASLEGAVAPALEILQSRGFAIPVHQPLAVTRNRCEARGLRTVGPLRHNLTPTLIEGMLVTKAVTEGCVLSRIGVLLAMTSQFRASEREENVVA